MTKKQFMQSPLFGKALPITGFNGRNVVQLNCCFVEDDDNGKKIVLTGPSAAGTKDFTTCSKLAGHSSFAGVPDDSRIVYRVHGKEYNPLGVYHGVRARKNSKGSTVNEAVICLRAL